MSCLILELFCVMLNWDLQEAGSWSLEILWSEIAEQLEFRCFHGTAGRWNQLVCVHGWDLHDVGISWCGYVFWGRLFMSFS